jgi:hypothetical protein
MPAHDASKALPAAAAIVVSIRRRVMPPRFICLILVRAMGQA